MQEYTEICKDILRYMWYVYMGYALGVSSSKNMNVKLYIHGSVYEVQALTNVCDIMYF